jgi:hypothetical protein
VTERGHTELDNETERALTDLVMNCPELAQLEALLSRFNIFRVLRAARHEIRHATHRCGKAGDISDPNRVRGRR